jgi:hypothetical protein
MIYDDKCGAVSEMSDRGDKKLLRENLLQCCFAHHISHMTRPVLKARAPFWEVGN